LNNVFVFNGDPEAGDGVGSIAAAPKTVNAVKYFDLTGKTATGATKGFVIKKTIYDDGSIENGKAIIQ
jgi:hypothetical protein